MDDFVCKKLHEWGLSELIQRFKEEDVDMESFYSLGNEEINNLIPKLGPRAKFKKRLKMLQLNVLMMPTDLLEFHEISLLQDHDKAADSVQVCPSTSGTSNEENIQKEKRNLDLQDESRMLPASKRRCDKKLSSWSEEIIFADVKNKMKNVQVKLQNEDNAKLNSFLMAKVCELETDKRELVGVFGKTGAGKSSLINAVIGAKNLLPSGDVAACTSVMIKVEANTQNSKYEADIEFITKEEWNDELWCMDHNRKDEDQTNEDDDYRDVIEKLSAVYGEEWKDKSPENLMDKKFFREIPEFLQCSRKILTSESARELSAKFVKYTRSDSKLGQDKDIKRWYWPLVKCVTVRVPNNELLQHVTLVDLPGNGDHNKSRDKMWKEIVGCCSTVWIVTEMNRAASETEAWDILKNASSLMGNGGECQRIDFICTKSDLIDKSDNHSAAEVRANILERNKKAKEAVITEFRKQNKIKKHFSEECFTVFTVSSTEFLKEEHLTPDDTEIPKLQEFLRDLNDCHSETLNYVSRAHGILSLIEGARRREVGGQKNDVCTDLEDIMRNELDKVRKPIEEAYKVFEKCLTDGLEESKRSCEAKLRSILYPKKVSGRGFHKILKHVVENSGTYKPKKQRQINMNEMLSSYLTESIDEEFRKTFPNERKCGPFNGVINAFSLDTERLIKKYKDVELQLIFLKTEEEKIKTKLNKIICERKKIIYGSLTWTIEEHMQECYKKAAAFRGQGTLENMRHTIEGHVRDSKDTMYKKAKDVLLICLNNLKRDILEELEKTLMKSIELSFKTDDDSIPDVSAELRKVKIYYNQLTSSPD